VAGCSSPIVGGSEGSSAAIGVGGGEFFEAGRDAKIFDRGIVNEVFLNDALEVFGRAGMIPDGIRVNDGNGTTGADAKAVGFAAMNERLRAAEVEIVEALFEKLPRGHALDRVATLGFGGRGAEKEVAFVAVEIEGLGSGSKEIRHGR